MNNNWNSSSQSPMNMPYESKFLFNNTYKKVTASERNNFGPAANVSKEDALRFARDLPAFRNWVTKLETNFGQNYKGVNILDIYPFGPVKSSKAGFVIANANVTKAGKPVPGFAFIRGGAVAVLPILENESGERFVLTLIQPRVPGAEKDYEEIPAGMLDGGAFGGVAAKEMKEETGITVKESDLTPLCLMYPSIGGCDENIKVFLFRGKASNSHLDTLEGKATGNPDENESIITKLTPYDEFKKRCLTSKITDVKAQVALGMYEMMMDSEIDMEGNPWKPKVDFAVTANLSLETPYQVTNLFKGGYHKGRKHTRKAKKSHKKRHTRKH